MGGVCLLLDTKSLEVFITGLIEEVRKRAIHGQDFLK